MPGVPNTASVFRCCYPQLPYYGPTPPSQLRAALGLQAFASQLAAPGPGGLLLPPLEVTHFLVADTADFVAVQFNTQGALLRSWFVGLFLS